MCLACDPGGSFWGSIVHVAAHSRGPICSPLYNEKKQITAVSYQRSKGPQNFSNNTNLTVRNHDTFDVLISSIVMQHAYVCIFHRCSCIEKIWNNRTQLNMVASKCSKNFLCCGRVKAFLKSRCTRSDCTKSLRFNRTWNTTMHGKKSQRPHPQRTSEDVSFYIAIIRRPAWHWQAKIHVKLILGSHHLWGQVVTVSNAVAPRHPSHLPSHCWVA